MCPEVDSDSESYLPWCKGGRCVWLTTYHPCSAETSRKSVALIYPEPLGPPRPVAGHLYFTRHHISEDTIVQITAFTAVALACKEACKLNFATFVSKRAKRE